MKISIITINYNNARGLEKTIFSVVNQTYSSIEYIIIDGGSTDGSKDVIKKYKDKITIWVSEPDKGIYHAMNKGIGFATGDYCLFLNSGDHLLERDTVESIAMCKPYADIVACDLIISGYKLEKYVPSKDKLPATWALINKNFFFHPSTFIKRSLFDSRKYDEDKKICSDWIFFFESVLYYNASYQHIPIACSKFYAGGISKNGNGKNEATPYLYQILPQILIDDLRNPKDVSMEYAMSYYTLNSVFRNIVYSMIALFGFLDRICINPLMSWGRIRRIKNIIISN